MVVASVLDDLYTKMMEKNLLNIVLPYERLQVSHVSKSTGIVNYGTTKFTCVVEFKILMMVMIAV